MADNTIVYIGSYDDEDAALGDLDSLEQLRQAEKLGAYDAAVIDAKEDKPRVVKHVHSSEGAAGERLHQERLEEMAKRLAPGEVQLVVVGEPTLEKGFHAAVTRALTTAKRSLTS
jgi:hypothetical protein